MCSVAASAIIAGIVMEAGGGLPATASCRLGSFVVQEDAANAKAPAIKAVRNARTGCRLADLNASFPPFQRLHPSRCRLFPTRRRPCGQRMLFMQIRYSIDETHFASPA